VDTVIYYGGPQKIADTFVLGQGFESISLNVELRRINRKWAERRECAHCWFLTLTNLSAVAEGKIKRRCVLTERAKALIRERRRVWPAPSDGSEPTEPSRMPPSTRPAEYSQVSAILPKVVAKALY